MGGARNGVGDEVAGTEDGEGKNNSRPECPQHGRPGRTNLRDRSLAASTPNRAV